LNEETAFKKLDTYVTENPTTIEAGMLDEHFFNDEAPFIDPESGEERVIMSTKLHAQLLNSSLYCTLESGSITAYLDQISTLSEAKNLHSELDTFDRRNISIVLEKHRKQFMYFWNVYENSEEDLPRRKREMQSLISTDLLTTREFYGLSNIIEKIDLLKKNIHEYHLRIGDYEDVKIDLDAFFKKWIFLLMMPETRQTALQHLYTQTYQLGEFDARDANDVLLTLGISSTLFSTKS
jgi:hypothetical protein